jgi:GntR family transcriptional repressor for pyruvate dehydrogenase complex
MDESLGQRSAAVTNVGEGPVAVEGRLPRGATGHTAFAPAKATRAFDDVVRQLRDRIYRGELQPGDRLPAERQLAEQFRVSRNMVREALRMLEITGIVELRKGATGGAFICRGRPEFVARSLLDMMRLGGFSLSDMTEARLWLSSTIVRAACERATEEDLTRLEANVVEAVQLAVREDWASVAVVNIEFHNLLASASGNPVLAMVQRSIMEVMREISLVAGPIRSDVTIRSRTRFLRHLRRRNVEQAVAEMDRNLRRVHEFFQANAPDGDPALRSFSTSTRGYAVIGDPDATGMIG